MIQNLVFPLGLNKVLIDFLLAFHITFHVETCDTKVYGQSFCNLKVVGEGVA